VHSDGFSNKTELAHQLHSPLGRTEAGVEILHGALCQLDSVPRGHKLITAPRGNVCASFQCRQVACRADWSVTH